MVDRHHPRLSIARQCELVSISRSSYYYRPCEESDLNLRLMQMIDKQMLVTPFYGSRQMTRHLKREGYCISRKRIRRLMGKMGICTIYQKPKLSTPHPDHQVYPYLLRDVAVSAPNQVWCADITYIPMRKGFMYLIAIMDWHSRKVLSWRLSNSLEADFCVEALEEALSLYGAPEIFNTDQGSQFTSHDWIKVLQQHDIKISMDGKGRWMDNVFIERLWRSLKYECIYLHEFDCGSAVKSGLREWFRFYNEHRPHSTFDGQTPHEVYTQIAA